VDDDSSLFGKLMEVAETVPEAFSVTIRLSTVRYRTLNLKDIGIEGVVDSWT